MNQDYFGGTMRIRLLLATVALAAACETPTDPSVNTSATTTPGSGGGTPSLSVGGNVRCVGTLTGTFDNVEVPPGATCTLENATVTGSVKALENARLFVANSQVRGNVEGDKASVVQVSGGTVRGNIEIKDGSSPSELGAAITGTVLTNGDLKIEKMNTGQVRVADLRLRNGNIEIIENTTSISLEILRNNVTQSVEVIKNGGAGNKVVSGNAVGQDLKCHENASPFTGGPNIGSKKEGQCF